MEFRQEDIQLCSPDDVEVPKPYLLFRPGPEDEVLVPSLPDFGLGQTVALADPPPRLWLVVAHGVCLGPVLVLRVDVADGSVVPAVTAGVNSPLDNVTPV